MKRKKFKHSGENISKFEKWILKEQLNEDKLQNQQLR